MLDIQGSIITSYAYQQLIARVYSKLCTIYSAFQPKPHFLSGRFEHQRLSIVSTLITFAAATLSKLSHYQSKILCSESQKVVILIEKMS